MPLRRGDPSARMVASRQLVVDEIGGDALPGERRQHPDVGDGRVAHDRSSGEGEAACHRVSGTDQLVCDERSQRATGLEQGGDPAGLEVRQRGKADHRGAKHIGCGQELVVAVKHPDIGGHPVIMSRPRRVGVSCPVHNTFQSG